MTNTSKLFELAQLAEASYAEFDKFSGDAVYSATEVRDALVDLRPNGDYKFSRTQATEFVKNWRVVHHQKNLTSGFSATLFEYIGNDPNSGFTTGELVYAPRGTEGVFSLDLWVADLADIVTDGLALDQIVDMYNDWKRVTAGNGNTYEAAVLETDVALTAARGLLPIGATNVFDATYGALGYIIDLPSGLVRKIEFVQSNVLFNDYRATGDVNINVAQLNYLAGHSLGGHLATAFSRLFPNLADVFTVNGAGFPTGNVPGLGGNAASNIFNLFHQLRGVNNFGNVQNIFGDKMPEIVTMNSQLGLVQPGVTDTIFIESGSAGNVFGHGSSQMTDSLAVANLFIKLDSSLASQTPGQALATLNALMEKSSNQAAQSLEKLVEGLSQAILGSKPTIDTDDRDKLYIGIKAITDSGNFQALIDKVALVAPPTSASEARNDFGAFLSLFYLTPFSLKANNAEANNLLLAIHTALGDKWTDDNNLSEQAKQNGAAHFSDMYLNDRAAMLSWVSLRNKDDIVTFAGQLPIDSGNAFTNASPAYFKDVASGTEIYLGSTENRRKIIFGSVNNEVGETAITGGSKADYLYGMGGNDQVNGGDGNDYIEGNAGQDTLNGDAGNDTLVGGADVDILDGGTGNDFLKGGAGVDVYQFNGTYGTDIITDSDGQGFVTITTGNFVSGFTTNPANGGAFKLENIYKNEGTGYTYTKLNGGTSIVISKNGDPNRVIINNWSETNNLSINLTGSAPAAPTTGNILNGDFNKKQNTDGSLQFNQLADYSNISAMQIATGRNGAIGNYIADGAQAGALDNLQGGIGQDTIYGFGGSDFLSGMEGDDYLDGGDGSDFIYAGLGKDTIIGGAGNDIILGSHSMFLTKTVSSVQNITTGNNGGSYIPNNHTTLATGWGWMSSVTNQYSEIPENVSIYDNFNTFFNFIPEFDYFYNTPEVVKTDLGNIIDGGDGDDYILAGTANDFVNGGADNDQIVGGGGDDILLGEAGGDIVFGDAYLRSQNRDSFGVVYSFDEHGNDIIDGGDGDDFIYGQGKDDLLFGGANNDKIWGDANDETLSEQYHGNDYLDGGDGNDTLVGGGKNDTLLGGNGNDYLYGDDGADFTKYAGNDYLDGGAGNDQLVGGTGNDTLIGGANIDTLFGGAGQDTYIYNLGDGVDTIVDNIADNNIFKFGVGINQQNIKLRLGSLLLDLGNGDAIHIEGFNQNDVFNSSSISRFEFADGTNLSLNQLLARGFDLDGTSGNDTLIGTNTADRINGLAGNDTLSGGLGNDTLSGGAGNDTYMHTLGSGIDTIIDTSTESNTLSFSGTGINQGNIIYRLVYTSSGSTLELDMGSGDVIQINNINPNDIFNTISINSFIFSNGSTRTASQILANGMLIYGTSGGDTINGYNNSDQIFGLAGNDILQGGAGSDTYHINLGDGTDTIIDNSTNTDSTPHNTLFFGQGITIESLTGTRRIDTNGQEYLVLQYGNNPNDNVSILNGFNGAVRTINLSNGNGSFSYQDIIANTVNTPLSLNGTASADNLISGKGDDSLNGNAGDDTLIGNAGNDLLEGGTGNDILIGGAGLDTYVLNTGTGSDTVIELNATSNRIMLGSAISLADLEVVKISNDLLLKIKNSQDSLNLKDYFSNQTTWQVSTADNSANTTVASLYNQYLENLAAQQLAIRIGTYKNNFIGEILADELSVAQSTYLNYNNVVVNTNLVVTNSNAATIYGTAQNSSSTSQTGSQSNPIYTITIQYNIDVLNGGATDNNIQHTQNDYQYSINGIRSDNGYPEIDGKLDIAHQIMDGGAGNDTLSGGGWMQDTNALFWNNSAIYNNLIYRSGSFFYGNAGNDTLIGTALADELIGGEGNDYMNGAAGADTYRVLAGANQGWDTIDDKGFMVNDFLEQVYGGTIATDTVVFEAGISRESLQFSWSINPISLSLSLDISWGIGSGIHVAMPGLPVIVASDFYGSYYAEKIGIESFQFADGISLTMQEMLALAPPMPTNSAPTIVNVISDQNALEGSAFTFIVPANTFTDADAGDVLTYSASLDNGDALPSWLTFDPVTRTFTSTALGANIGMLNVRVTATDILGLSVQDSFILTINPQDRTITGTSGNDTLVGGQGNDTIDGGAGVDVLTGGAGNDTYRVDLTATNALQDTVTEVAAGGVDTVILRGGVVAALSTITLGAEVDNLDASQTGTTLLNLTGNALANNIIGNASNNVLDGLVGADSMTGGDGNDTYVLDNIGDVVTETNALAAGGIDLVNVAIATAGGTYTLGANIENATITQTTLAYNLTGNALDNVLTGNAVANTLTGGDGNDTLNGLAGNDTMVGGLGNDTYTIDVLTDVVTEAASAGTDTVNVAIATAAGTYTLGANLENATLTNAVAYNLTGNAFNNILTGNAAANILDGGLGADTMVGGVGADTYVVDDLGDVVNETTVAAETDTVQSSISYTLGTNLENLTLTGVGNINGTGNALANTILGNTGNNILDGGAGVDALTGGAGNDTYLVDLTATNALQDTVTEVAAGGVDTVILRGGVVAALSTITLGAEVDNLDASQTGTTLLNLTGNALANNIIGNASNNVLDGLVGADSMTGGDGNDTYVLDNIGDVVTETNALAAGGIDLVNVAIATAGGTYTLGANIENATITQTTLAYNLTGNALDNVLTGNAVANTLTGGDGNDTLNGLAGNDTMVGGLGNDTYTIDVLTDVVTEAASAGTDTVNVAIATAAGTYTLGANLENATLTNAVAYNLTGNAFNNILTGNAAANILDGGLGADTMVGGVGADTYVVDDLGDVVNETTVAAETDTVQSSISYTLGTNLENLTLTGVGNINGTGNALANTILGNTGNNILDGGAGVDALTGGAGNDTYLVDLTATNALQDTVTEVAAGGVDTVILRGGVVAALSTITLGAEVDNLDASQTGTTLLNLTGNALANNIIGNASNNVLDGLVGADSMTGGDGNDTYVLDNIGDVVTETNALAAGGIDLVNVAIATAGGTYTLGANIENATITQTTLAYNLTGNALDNVLTGNAVANTLTGGDGNDTLNGLAGNDTMVGGLGNDTYTIDVLTDVVTEAASAGTDTVNVAIATAAGTYTLGANLENATLTNAVAYNLTGNAFNNILTGNAAANILDGGLGADTMVGGVGADTYVVDDLGDVVNETTVAAETDTVQSSISYTLGTNLENLTLTGVGNINGTGNALANTILGNTGNNILDGGAGVDALTGGAGNDTYLVDLTATNALQDTVTEVAAGGVDTVILRGGVVAALSTITLGAEVDNLDASQTGTTLLNLTGNALANNIIGNASNNVLDGLVGADSMTGGDGNDTYVLDNIGDVVTETNALAAGGIDLVNVAIATAGGTYTLGANIENATITQTTLAYNLTGNALDNVLTGNAVANTLTGGDGNDTLNGLAGNDTMVGGLGNDTYTIDVLTDVVTEAASAGTDTVNVAIATAAGTYTLGANLENATLTNAVAYNLTGNAFNNILTGNAAANILDGGLGADTMVGGVGADTYVVDDLGDVVNETTVAAETDTVQSSISYTLGTNLENLTLTGVGNINGTGNALANTILGNTGNNILDGGAGVDALTGGAGNDTYLVDLTATNALQDTVTEVAAGGVDTVILRGGVVAALSTITLGAEVDNLDASQTGTTLLNLTGNALANNIIGNASNNVLDGLVGADSMTGGDGNDTYVLDNIGDVVTETNALAAGGIDLVNVAIATAGGTYTLGANIENATITQTTLAYNLTGNALDNVLTGNAVANTLTGGDGNDTLNGLAGNDTMVGGLGNDTYTIDVLTDVVTEAASAGTDTVNVAIATAAGTYTLGANLENATLTNAVAYNLTGNAFNNILTGNAAANILDGGLGADTMVGGVGADTYVVDDLGDVVNETTVAAETDTVQSSISYTLGTNLENLTLTGVGNINGTGNALANTILGNTGNNILDGGAGVDALTGGAGNDTYLVDLTATNALQDTVTEVAAGGVDTVILRGGVVAALSTITLGAEVDNLDASQTGTTLLNLTGNALANNIIGNASNNVLDGLVGADSMTGGDGNDTYVLDNIGDVVTETNALAAGGIDLVNVAIATAGGTYTLGANIENATITQTTLAYNLTGNALDNVLTGNAVANTLTGGDGNDTLNGLAGNDTMVGGLGNDTYTIDVLTDVVTEAASAGTDTVNVAIATAAGTYTVETNVENAILTNTVAYNLTGNALANYLRGNAANNTLTDTAGGNDILQGLAGTDILNDTVGNNLFDGGTGNDTITGGIGRDIFIGGAGNDTITTGTGFDVISFNKGDGADIINASTGADNTISLGGNFAYSELSLTKTANDLILKMGATDQITLKDWYLSSPTNKSVINLQVVAEAIQGFTLGGADNLRNNRIENFNFTNLVAAFDVAGATANWQLTDSRLTTHLLAGSDTAAIGGDLAYQYGKNSNLTSMGTLNAQSVISNASFGQTAQTMNNPTVWQAELVKLG